MMRSLVLTLCCTIVAVHGQSPSGLDESNPVRGIQSAKWVETLPLNGTLYHVQGVDLDRDHIWITSVDIPNRKGYLHQFSRKSGAFERQVVLNDGPRFHPGGFSIAGDSIWVPVAEYKHASTAVLLELDRTTLKVKRRIEVGDHLGCVAVTGSGELIAGNWSSRKLYIFDKSGKQVRVVENPSKTEFQDMKFVNGLLVGSGNTPKGAGKRKPGETEAGDVVWLSWPALETVRTLAAGTTDRNRLLTAEGMALKGHNLYLVPEDGPSRLFHFVLP